MVNDNCKWFRDSNFPKRFGGHELAPNKHCIPFDESLTADGLPREPSGIAMKRLLEKAIPPPFLLPAL